MKARARKRLARMFALAYGMRDSLARCMALTWCYALMAKEARWATHEGRTR